MKAARTTLKVIILFVAFQTIFTCKKEEEVLPPPAAPTSLSGTATSATTITLTWTDNAGDETGFKIERAIVGGTGYTEIATVGANVTTYQNTGLTATTTYTYRVRAFNNSGNSAFSNAVTIVTPDTVPAAPSNLTASAILPTQINLSWTDNSSNETGFKIERAPGGTTTFTEIATVTAGTTSYQNTGLTASTSYSYRVVAFNAAGNSSYSNTATATTPATTTVPTAPANLTATAVSSSQINLAWTDNSSNEQGFKIERAPGGTTTFAEITTVGAGITSYSNTGLTASTSYSYRVRAYNTAGNSGYTNTATATTSSTTTIPTAPSNLAATASSSSQINLAWSDNASNEQGFRIERAPGGTSTFAEIATVGAGVTTYQNTGLTASTSYNYRVRAYNTAGNSGYSNTASATTLAATVPPVAPTNLTATAASTSAINLAWTDNSSDEQGFRIERAPGGTTTFSEIATVAAGVTSYSNTGLGASTSYSYRVRAYNANGNSGYTNTASATTFTPPAAPGITAPTTSTGSFTVTLTYSWPSLGSSTDKYQLEESTVSSTSGFSVTYTSPDNTRTTPYAIALTRTTGTYYYRARVYTNSVWSSYSTVVQVTVTVANGVLRIVNNTKYDMIDIRLNSAQKVSTNQGVLIGNYADFTYTSAGTVNYTLGVGFWESGVRNVWFTLTGTATITLGQTTTVTFNNPTINQLLSGFSSSNDWLGEYWISTTLYYAKFRYFSNGNWQLYDNVSMTGAGGTLISSGTVTLTSWTNYATVVKFKNCSTCAEISLLYPFGQFYYNNGPTSWPTILYVRQ
ncbi:MAG: fibronectin type III domain-containing protein [Cyclobacteriaceae bacterium]|nr:fibronectin type III domain-containing protein [Cyclobacteriaceae bacterium]